MKKEAGVLETFIADISKVLESFAENDSAARQSLNQLANADPGVFFAAGIRVVAAVKPSEASRYLVQTLAKDKRLSIGLLDPKVCTAQEAMAVSRAAAEAGAQLQSTFEMALNKALQGQASPQNADRILRILDVLAVTCGQNCWNSFQVELMAYPDKVVRSKAALLIGRSARNSAWLGRRLLDRDTRVQANAVEALWGLDAAEATPHLLGALKSKNNRVAANAALGLYRIGDVQAIRVLLEMLRHEEPLFRLSALWAIGETQDPRFLPVLAKYFENAKGKLRLAAAGAMSRIRRREKAAGEAATLQIHVSQATAQPGGQRRLSFALSCHPARDLSGVKATEFAVREGETLIEGYEVQLVSPPALLIAGFVAPWFASETEPYEKCVREALRQCLAMKRRDDLWRVDHYSTEMNPPADGKSSDPAVLSYDDSLITPELKALHGCMCDRQEIEKAISVLSPRQRAAADMLAAIQRQCEALGKHAGKRHVFLLLHEMSGFDLKQEEAVGRLRALARDNSIVFHGICPDVAGQWALLRDLCLSNSEGSFTETKLEGMVDGLVDAYANLCSRFEITYALPGSIEPGAVELKVLSNGLAGQAQISLEAPPPKPAAAAGQREAPSAPPGAQVTG
jgi:HEAT repeats